MLVTRAPIPPKWFVLDADAIVEMDSSGADALRQVLELLAERGVTFAVSRSHQKLRSLLENYDLLEQIGEDRLYATNRDAAAAFHSEDE